jgi:hypothetical protein
VRFKLPLVLSYFLRLLIAAEAISFVIATKETKKPSCCDHLSAAQPYAGPGATAGLCASFEKIIQRKALAEHFLKRIGIQLLSVATELSTSTNLSRKKVRPRAFFLVTFSFAVKEKVTSTGCGTITLLSLTGH